LNIRRARPWASLAAAFGVLLFLLPAQAASPLTADQLRQKAKDSEDKGQWLDACTSYDQLSRTDHSQDVQEHFLICLRHVHQLRRHRDPSFLKTVLKMKLPEALAMYEDVLNRVQANYVEQDKSQTTKLYEHGLEEFRFALADPTFLQEHLPSVPAARVRDFLNTLDRWESPNLKDDRLTPNQMAARSAKEVALAAVFAFDKFNATTVILEFICGACNALDEYTLYLTPNQFRYVNDTLKGEYVGVGIRVGRAEQKLVIANVVPNSPAGEKGLKAGDRIVRIDGQSVEGQSAEAITSKLQGKAGSTVELEVAFDEESGTQTVKLVRQAVTTPSVEFEPMLRDGIGYVRILCFQESTPQELKDAILQLQSMQMKALVLDLRGNPGGLFMAGVQVAEMFIPKGMIVSTVSPVKKLNKEYPANNPNALTFPLVVLVDGDTASAAEVVAGALKENDRATLVGGNTFGKGTIQFPLPLESSSSGVWITAAKFFSPSNQPYSGRGVAPHILVEVDMMGSQRQTAWQTAQQLLMMTPR
jgi:carboxyl-terminal processing protease